MMNNAMKGMSLVKIHEEIRKFGFELSDAQFNALTYTEIKRIYRKAEKSYRLKQAIVKELQQKFAPASTPATAPSHAVAKSEKAVKKNG